MESREIICRTLDARKPLDCNYTRFFRKKGILILFQCGSILHLSIRASFRPSVTFLVNVSPPKP